VVSKQGDDGGGWLFQNDQKREVMKKKIWYVTGASQGFGLALGENPDPPLHLWLGSNAVERAGAKIEAMARELEQWRELSVSADF
jgi:hypothetical protein